MRFKYIGDCKTRTLNDMNNGNIEPNEITLFQKYTFIKDGDSVYVTEKEFIEKLKGMRNFKIIEKKDSSSLTYNPIDIAKSLLMEDNYIKMKSFVKEELDQTIAKKKEIINILEQYILDNEQN